MTPEFFSGPTLKATRSHWGRDGHTASGSGKTHSQWPVKSRSTSVPFSGAPDTGRGGAV